MIQGNATTLGGNSNNALLRVKSYKAEEIRLNNYKYNIPEEYQLVEYIGTTGTLWINTGVVINATNYPTLEYYLDVKTTNISVGNNWFVHGLGGNSACCIYVGIDNGNGTITSGVPFVYGSGTADTNTGINGAINARYKYTINYGAKTYLIKNVNNEVVADLTNITTSTPSGSGTLVLSKWWTNASSGGYLFSSDIYECRISFDGVDAAHLIPCYRISDNVAGMYDLVSGNFLVNAGSGTFTIGPDIYELDTEKADKVKTTKEKSIIPNEYKQVDCITSTGTQYINTNYKPTNNTKIEIKYYSNAADDYIFGSRTSSSSTDMFAANVTASTLFPQFGSTSASVAYASTGFHTLLMSLDYALLDSIRVLTYSTMSFNGTYPIYLCGLNEGGNLEARAFDGSIYYVKIYEKGKLVRQYIPCYKKSNNEAGLYELFNEEFLTNSGTGIFTYTDTFDLLPDGYQLVEYIESTGTLYVDTSYTNSNVRNIEIKTKFRPIVNGASKVIFGSETPYSLAQVLNGYLYFGTSEHYQALTSFAANTTYEASYYYDKSALTTNINGTIVNATYAGDVSLKYPIYLFAHNSSGTMNQISVGRIYYFKLYCNGKLVRDMIPCYEKASGLYGFYDLISQAFFGNVGTGDFYGGSNISYLTNINYAEFKISNYGSYTYKTAENTEKLEVNILKTDTMNITPPTCIDMGRVYLSTTDINAVLEFNIEGTGNPFYINLSGGMFANGGWSYVYMEHKLSTETAWTTDKLLVMDPPYMTSFMETHVFLTKPQTTYNFRVRMQSGSGAPTFGYYFGNDGPRIIYWEVI